MRDYRARSRAEVGPALGLPSQSRDSTVWAIAIIGGRSASSCLHVLRLIVRAAFRFAARGGVVQDHAERIVLTIASSVESVQSSVGGFTHEDVSEPIEATLPTLTGPPWPRISSLSSLRP